MNTLYINYTRTGKPVSDMQVENEIIYQDRFTMNGNDKQFDVSTENIITASRCMKLNNDISCDLKIMFEGEELTMNEYMVISKHPFGFCDFSDRWTTKLLRRQMEIHKGKIDERKSEKNG